MWARKGSKAVKNRSSRILSVIALGSLVLAGCVTTENGRVVGTGSPPGAAIGQSTSGPSGSDRSASDERRRRSDIRLQLAAQHYQQGNYRQAMTEVNDSIEIDRQSARALGMRGLINWQIGDRPAAEDDFRRALALAPKDADINNNYGWYLCKTDRPRESIAYFQTATEDLLYRTPAMPLHNAGICSLQAGDEVAAENYFARSFQIDPNNPVAMFNLGELYLKRSNLERAKFYSDRLLAQYQPSAETLWLALRVARAGGDRNYASSVADQLERRFPGSREAALMKQGAYK